jgi:hypothetical protein
MRSADVTEGRDVTLSMRHVSSRQGGERMALVTAGMWREPLIAAKKE